MKNKSFTIPYGMIFKKHYCSKCGERLKKEKTHRVVSKDDVDYYMYHDVGMFPRNDHDVYDYRFKCPSCGARISYNEQCVIRRIQKKRKSRVLSSSEIRESYKECRRVNDKTVLIRNILIPIFVTIIAIALLFLLNDDMERNEFIFAIGVISVLTLSTIIVDIKKYKGKGKLRTMRSYSYEKESQLKRLHAYSSHNRKMVEASEKCYCFYCKSCLDSREIEKYIDNDETAVCPKCGADAIVPDSVGEVDEKVIVEMNEYWY